MNDFTAKKGEAFTSHFDIIRKIETISAEIPYAIKQFKAQLLSFLSMDRRLSSLKAKTEKNANSKTLDRYEGFLAEYQGAYKKCTRSYASIVATLDEIQALYSKLTDFYYSEGKRREAKRAGVDAEKYDKLARKQLSLVYARIDSATNLSVIEEAKDEISSNDAYQEKPKSLPVREEKREEERRQKDERVLNSTTTERFTSQASQYAPANQYTQSAQYGANPAHFVPPQYQSNPYAYSQVPPAYYPPVQNVNVTPITIDVNAAVEAIFASFSASFDKKIAEYVSTLSFPAPAANIGELESSAIEGALSDENFAVEKLSGLFEKIDAMLGNLSAVTAKYSELEEKAKSISEAMKSAVDTQRALAREIQGIQATQKVISLDVEKLSEEQKALLLAEKSSQESQKELTELHKAVSGEIDALLDGANKALTELRSGAETQAELFGSLADFANAGDKLLDMQKNLGARQSELADMQRDALLAQKKLARSQKALNERSGAKVRSRAEKGADAASLDEEDDEAALSAAN